MAGSSRSKHPYRDLSDYTRWSKAVSSPDYADVDPVSNFPFRITADEKVATAGSCFAQHIARHLSKSGFNYFVTEDGHPLGDADLKNKFNYGVYSARYGNIYTSRQLLQLFKRAFLLFKPSEGPWIENDGIIDPFRPAIQPGGFKTLVEYDEDRKQHLRAVRRIFDECDVFVFTLGLTEHWYCRSDGAALPVCPGVAGGTFDPERYGFANLTVAEVVTDMSEFISLFREVNPRVKIILTVSPVPLAATAENRHVLVSTVYSKSVLRVAAEELTSKFKDVAYFPSYEIITGNFNRGRYFADDLRSVTEDGVTHVMRLFLDHATDLSTPREVRQSKPDNQYNFINEMQNVVQTTCEENLIESSMSNS
ncbi:GSCFA domain-containing protein [Methylobacterium nonmethylotrophicum]|uniref:GSCFA domain-containing protein n=1 Tax=Methylobacterium nonmethylotrophicum TaxID=1141884 RepID=A0A4Z0NWN8_9HYPH|nr:GSCFA domain-containing protein [Methylobacterium nonmethylotrophicum]TGE01697.1 GSCFA domain-containing protein [Methylobacterium nonmethylotrophicum]